MSYLDQFLKETSSNQQQTHTSQQFEQVLPTGQNQPQQQLLYHGTSIESEEGDIEDNRALSIASSKSNLSEVSLVSLIIYTVDFFQLFFCWKEFYKKIKWLFEK